MNKKEELKNLAEDKAITLISLVITIIILIILAGMSINLILGENGIITKANEAKTETRGAMVEETVYLWKTNQEIDNYSGSKTAQKLEKLLNDLETQKLITPEERAKIEQDGEIIIGSKTIIFDETKISTELDWTKILADANANPSRYAYPGQSSENKDIGIGTDGKAVNMDLWAYRVEYNKIDLNGGSVSGYATSYSGEFTEEGKIQGTVPQYIKPDGYDEFLPVTAMTGTFNMCEDLKIAPEIPTTVEKLNNTFIFTNLTKITIPNSVTSIEESAFAMCTGLTEITIPQSVTFLGNAAFAMCTSLKEIIIPDSVTNIGFGVLGGCSGLTSIKVDEGNNAYYSGENCNVIINKSTNTLLAGCANSIIPTSVTSIDDSVFAMNTSLTEITIPDNVTDIGANAFRGCSNLKTINYTGTEEQWNAITKGEDWNLECPSDMKIVFNYGSN